MPKKVAALVACLMLAGGWAALSESYGWMGFHLVVALGLFLGREAVRKLAMVLLIVGFLWQSVLLVGFVGGVAAVAAEPAAKLRFLMAAGFAGAALLFQLFVMGLGVFVVTRPDVERWMSGRRVGRGVAALEAKVDRPESF